MYLIELKGNVSKVNIINTFIYDEEITEDRKKEKENKKQKRRVNLKYFKFLL